MRVRRSCFAASYAAFARRPARRAFALAAVSASLVVAAPSFASVPTGWSLAAAVDGGTSSIGSSIATTDSVAAVGAPFATATDGGAATGAVFVYANAGGGWIPQKVVAPSPVSGGNFGTSVAVSGNLLAVGAVGTPPSAYVFAADAGVYVSVDSLADPAADKAATFGGSVAVYAGEGAASYVAVAQPPGSGNPTGAVYVSRQDPGGAWSSPPVAITEPSADSFGIALAFAGNGQLLVGDPGTTTGQVLVYSPLADGGWSKEDSLAFSLDGGTVQQFGNGIATSGNLAVVTAPGTSGTSNAANDYNGAAFVFEATDAGVWQQTAVLTGAAAETFANFLPAVSDGLVAVGSAVNTASSGSGQVDVWAQNGGAWVAVPSSTLVGDSYYGQAVGIVGGSLFVGDTSAAGAAAISDVTSSLFIETATYADGGALTDATVGATDGAVGADGSAPLGVDGAVPGADASGSSADSGSPDAGDGGIVESEGGCGCTVVGEGAEANIAASLAAWSLLALGWARRRRARPGAGISLR
jgi:MYXO-CTERM domain-containing protein